MVQGFTGGSMDKKYLPMKETGVQSSNPGRSHMCGATKPTQHSQK